MTFLRLRKMPNTPSVNRIAETVRKCEMPTAHQMPLPVSTFLISIAVAGVRATCAAISGA